MHRKDSNSITLIPTKQQAKEKDHKLLLLQQHLTAKIARTTDEQMIRHYLQQCQRIAEQRFALQKRGEL